jgi:hypothetical protein
MLCLALLLLSNSTFFLLKTPRVAKKYVHKPCNIDFKLPIHKTTGTVRKKNLAEF